MTNRVHEGGFDAQNFCHYDGAHVSPLVFASSPFDYDDLQIRPHRTVIFSCSVECLFSGLTGQQTLETIISSENGPLLSPYIANDVFPLVLVEVISPTIN